MRASKSDRGVAAHATASGAALREIISFLAEMSGERVEPDARLIDDGVVDSFGMVELLAFVEQRFSVQFRANDAESLHLQTPRELAQWVAEHGRKAASRPAAGAKGRAS